MIGIRVDANERIAMGHLMRCLSIAQQLKILGQTPLFIISEEQSVDQIQEAGFESICLQNSYKNKDEELPRLIEVIREYQIHKMLIDSYGVTEQYMRTVKEYCKVIYIDDLNSFRYPADMIVNYTFKTKKRIYEAKGYGEELFLLGADYVPLRIPFSEGCIEIKPYVEDIFLTTGGADEYNMIVGMLEKMQGEECLKRIKKHVVVGRFYGELDKLYEVSKKHSEISVYHNVSDVWKIMRKCDLAISAGGTTLAELCACGVPTICFSLADNQLEGTKAYSEERMMIYVGDVRKNKTDVLEKISKQTQRLLGDWALRSELAEKANSIIDGKGATRIAESIIAMK